MASSQSRVYPSGSCPFCGESRPVSLDGRWQCRSCQRIWRPEERGVL